ncbi:MAG: hypothetical protein R2745_15230 [Vicinamibacterales bacterium]
MVRRAVLAAVLMLAPGVALAQNTTVLTLTPAGSPVSVGFEAARSAVLPFGSGYYVTGDVAMLVGSERLVMAGAALFFEGDGTGRLTRVHGTAGVPSPITGAVVEITQPAVAQFGMDLGANIDLGVPLADDRTYFYFAFDSGFAMEVGMGGATKPVTLAIPAGVNATLIVDPLDPFFFFAGDYAFPGLGGGDGDGGDQPGDGGDDDGPTEGGLPGFGVSVQGLIPFRPGTTYGIDQFAKAFSGHRIQMGSFQLGTLPVEMSGYLVSHALQTDDAPATNVLAALVGPPDELGANGHFTFTYSFLKVKTLGELADFGFDLGDATAAVQITDGVQQAYFSGVIEPDTSWLPDVVPFKPEARLRAYAYVSSRGTDFLLHADGRFAIDASAFGEAVNVDLGDVMAVEGSLHVDATGFRIQGMSDDGLGALGVQNRRAVELWIPFQGDSGYLRIDGVTRVAGIGIEGQMLVDKTGLTVTGRYDSPDLDMQVQGFIGTIDGTTRVRGTMSVPPVFQSQAAQAIVQSADEVAASIANALDDYKRATSDYEFELSLRGMRTLVPAFCDGALSALDAGERTALARIDSEWPWYAPGKSTAKSQVRSQVGAMRTQFRSLKSLVTTGDDATVRAALDAALAKVLANQVLRVKVTVLGTIYTRDLVSSTQAARLTTARAAIAALPATSDRVASTEQVWREMPTRDELMDTARDIANGVAGAMPQVVAIGFDQPHFETRTILFVDVTFKGQVHRVTVVLDPARPQDLGTSIGKALADLL